MRTFIAVSDYVVDLLINLGVPPGKIVRHYTGIPIPEDPGQVADRAGVLFVGRLVDKKGCIDLLQAVGDLTGGLCETPVRVIGDGPWRARLEEYAESRALNVTFLGMQPPSVVADEMKKAAVFCVPSQITPLGDVEAFGMVFVEASSQRLPVITYNSGGTPEAVADGETGMLVVERDVAGLSRALERLLLDPCLQRDLGERGRARAVSEFDIVSLGVALEQIYDRSAGV